MKAIILAAGRGTRMGNLTLNKPKCLLEVGGKTLLEWQLDAIKGAGISEIAIVTGYRRECLQEYGLVEFHNSHWAHTNMFFSLTSADEWLKKDDCIVSYSDIFYETNAIDMLKNHEAEIAITYDPEWLNLWSQRFKDPLDDAEIFKIDKTEKLIEIGKKPKSVEQIQGQYMGLLRFRPAGWIKAYRIFEKLSQKSKNTMHMTGMLDKIMKARILNIETVCYKGIWGEIDSESDLEIYKNTYFS